MSQKSELDQLLDRFMDGIEAINARLNAVEASVNDSLSRAKKCERGVYGDPQPPAPRTLAPAAKGSLAAKSLGLG